MTELLTLRRAAERLSVSERTVRRYIRQGLLPAFRVPGKRRLYVRAADLEALLRPEPNIRAADVAVEVDRLLR